MGFSATAPGLTFTAEPRPVPAEPVRTDVAVFVGNFRRGPVGQLVRLEDWRGCMATLGPLDERFHTSYCVHGYFENGATTGWMYRLGGFAPGADPVARIDWTIPNLVPAGPADRVDAMHAQFRLEASSPGVWANGGQLQVHQEWTQRSGLRIDVTVSIPGEPTEYFSQVGLERLAADIAERSGLIRLIALDEEQARTYQGPRAADYTLVMDGGIDPAPNWTTYTEAVALVSEEPEIAILAFPDLTSDVPFDGATAGEHLEVLRVAIAAAEADHDRIVLIDAPPAPAPLVSVERLEGFANAIRDLTGDPLPRSAAFYYPWIKVLNPPGAPARPLRTIPPCGHVAGVMSRLDRQRGPHHTPANAEIFTAVDVTEGFSLKQRGALNEAGINLLRCFPGQGLLVYGGRTLAREQKDLYVAHRRLIHKLVRAIRRTAEPLVFESNTPELWLALVRTITTVLLEAFRSGALKGARPEEAFRVKCDDETNPPEAIDNGRVVCEIQVAPAMPMEFIHLRVALGAEGVLEVFES